MTSVRRSIRRFERGAYQENQRRSQIPGAVPQGYPPADIEAFPWLHRNEFGAIDMSRYTHEQWLSTGLPYCAQCMNDPGDVRFALAQGPDGPYGVDPCPHGTVCSVGRLVIYALALQSQLSQVLPQYVTFATLNQWQHTGRPSARPLMQAWMFQGVVEQGRRREITQIANLYQAFVHPEIDGIWAPRARGVPAVVRIPKELPPQPLFGPYYFGYPVGERDFFDPGSRRPLPPPQWDPEVWAAG